MPLVSQCTHLTRHLRSTTIAIVPYMPLHVIDPTCRAFECADGVRGSAIATAAMRMATVAVLAICHCRAFRAAVNGGYEDGFAPLRSLRW